MFINLHCHSEYSLADGLFSPKKWAKAYSDRGEVAAALTDHGVMGGCLPFYYACKEEGVLPILGCEFYFNESPSVKAEENRKTAH